MQEIERQIEIIKKNTVEIIEEQELKEKLKRSIDKNIPLRIKYGIDPTAPEIHLGHTVPIKKLKDFQDLGHKVLFLIGDFTARIGDPTGRKETRPVISEEEIRHNLSRYKEQVGKILDLSKTEFVYNSHWLAKLTLEEIVKLASIFTIAQILEREDFFNRYKSNKPIFFHEFLYPLLQGYDSCALKADVEIGATEQKFNLLAGRTIQEAFGQEKQLVITMPILRGTDGKLKMSKTYGNHIPVDATPDDMFGKIMSIPDDIMEEYFSLLTSLDKTFFKKMIKDNPREAKGLLAKEIVKEFFDEKKAEEAERKFDKVFKEKQIPDEIPEFAVEKGEVSVVDILFNSGILPSKMEARRMIIQKAVKIDNNVIEDPYI
ncbi:MAG: tyrosine--tRNA ligase, partial [Candidatus Omnitrophica bacterium]|nr:tyrosine--tRNA ligase [Candidatus Omnitrophota bacterium]